jgi:beta-N-acetylhexosaminidase
MFVGCAATTPPSGIAATPTAALESPVGSPSAMASPLMTAATPTAVVTPAPTAATSCADRTLASLTEPQRIGQLFMLGLIRDQLDAGERDGIARFHFGSMAFTAKTAAGVGAVRAITDAVQAEATPSATGGVRFLIAANQEGGLIQALSGPGFAVMPSALSQGGLAPAALERLAARWGRELGDAGVNLDLAPVADVVPSGTAAQNAPIGQLEREFGHDPATVASHVTAFIAGMRDAGIGTTVKHFPGLGRVEGNTDFTAGVIDSVTKRNDPYLAPFAKAIHAGVPFVMVSLATYEKIDAEHLAVFSPTVIGGMLRGDLGYRGVVISDALGAAKAIASIPPAARAVDFLGAGGDMIISNQLAPAIAMAGALRSRADEDPAFGERIDDAALHVLRAKESLGLLPCGG